MPWCGRGSPSWCSASSPGAVYLVNDLRDLEQDRLHPRKRTRPLASGALPVPVARDRRGRPPRRRPGRGRRPGPGLRAWPRWPTFSSTSPTPSGSRTSSSSTSSRSPSGFVLRAVAGALAIDVRLQHLAAGLHDSAGPLPLPGQAAPRAGLSRGRRQRAPAHPGRVQPLPSRPDDLGGDRLVPHRLRLLHAWPRRRWRSTRPTAWPSPSPSCSTASSGIFTSCTAAKGAAAPPTSC